MGRQIIQTIYTCDLCGETPEDGGKLWHMNRQVWCEKCCDKVDNGEIVFDEYDNVVEVGEQDS